ncbi:MAG: tail fiber protein [Nitrosomonas sp.]|uniref:phage tail protein n=1 Tax=Nitrosomonas sp. TaxID=42353 RepID=UPI0025CE4278|nr:tail fiber protein [Nitrosomonas sp.]MBY0473936.1 tail fiber protein [Nitrosomonas sp.]
MKPSKKTPCLFSLIAAMMLMSTAPNTANAGMEPFIGEISYVAFNFAPQGWYQCDGQTLPISQYQALFSLLGATYGGNGTTTFALPDMRGRVPVHKGQHPGGSMFDMGQVSGAESMALTVNNMPTHSHLATATSTSTSAVAPGSTATSTLKAVNSDADIKTAAGNSLANAKGLGAAYSAAAPNVSMSSASIETTLNGLNIVTTTSTNVDIGMTGGSQPFSIMQPYTVVNCIIAWNGVYPSRP